MSARVVRLNRPGSRRGSSATSDNPLKTRAPAARAQADRARARARHPSTAKARRWTVCRCMPNLTYVPCETGGSEGGGRGLTQTIALYGGQPRVGKTTAAMNLAVLAARAGRRTCLAHMDPGWPAAQALGVAPTEGVARSVRPGLDLALLPNDGHSLARRGFSPGADAQVVLLDVPSPPAAAVPLLRCADQVILLARAGKDALPGLARDLGLVMGVLAGGDVSLKVTGLLMTLADPSLASFERFLVQAERAFPAEVLPYCIPRANAGDEESDLVVEFAATGRRARAYVEIAMEVLEDG